MTDSKYSGTPCCDDHYIESRRSGGWWKCALDADGEVIDTNLDSVVTDPIPKTAVCASCGKRHPNPRYEAGIR